jgi:tetratricopeptide (TPR) repeat protein
VDVYDGLITLFNDHKKFDAAVKACQEFLEIRGNKTVEQVKPFVMEQMILALAKQSKFDDALKLTEKLVEADEGGWYFLRLKAEVLREAGKLDESIGAFEDTIERLGKSKLKDDERDKYIERCRYVLSGVYTDLGKIDKAAGELQRLLKAYPDRATYHNDLGYIWADHDLNLDEAEKLIRKALELDAAERKKLMDQGLIDGEDDKANAAYLDSLGWVRWARRTRRSPSGRRRSGWRTSASATTPARKRSRRSSPMSGRTRDGVLPCGFITASTPPQAHPQPRVGFFIRSLGNRR